MDFRIGAKLGRGPLGASYSGQLAAGGAPVVVKVITSRFDEHPHLLEQVLADVRSWTSFRHPNAVATLALSSHEGRHVALFEPAPGKPLTRWLEERGPFDARAAVRIVRDVSLALAQAHRAGLACGDVRAAKVYHDGQRIALADLGQGRGSCLAAGLGAVGMHFGHPDALAPEVVSRRIDRPTPAADVYALGVLLYELLAGAPPFRGDPKALLRQHLEAPLPPLPVVQASPALARFMGRLVAKTPEQRFPDAAAVLEGLYELVGRPAPPASAAPALTSTVWRDVAAQLQATAPPATWSAERVEKAAPVGPEIPERTTSMRLPRQLLSSTIDEVAAAQQASGSGDGEGVTLKLGRKIGQGPVGSTYEGKLADHPHPVAVKVISQRFSKYPELLARILESMKKAEGLVDAHIVGLVRVVHVAGRDAAVAEMVAGAPLRDVLQARHRLPAAEVLDIMKDVALALQQGRGRELSHGDVRPAKVFVAPGAPARLADFGFAEASGLGANFGRFGVPWGHPDYLAPEVVQEPTRRPDFQTDCYALGIMAYELLTGRLPFTGPTPQEVLKAHLQAPLPPPPREANVPAPLAELVLRLAAKDPRRRPEAPLELLGAIDRCKKQVELAARAVASPPVEEFDPTASGERGQGWMPVELPAPPRKKKR